MKFEIKNYLTGSILFSLETDNLKLCVEAAVKSGADLGDANLRSANLRSANLRSANLGDANLWGANLGDANLWGAKIETNITVTKPPIQILGLEWLVTIWDAHMQIGCEFHSHNKWIGFSDDDWLRMGGKAALKMKREQFPAIIKLCDLHKPNEGLEAISE